MHVPTTECEPLEPESFNHLWPFVVKNKLIKLNVPRPWAASIGNTQIWQGSGHNSPRLVSSFSRPKISMSEAVDELVFQTAATTLDWGCKNECTSGTWNRPTCCTNPLRLPDSQPSPFTKHQFLGTHSLCYLPFGMVGVFLMVGLTVANVFVLVYVCVIMCVQACLEGRRDKQLGPNEL